LLVYGH